MKDPVVVDKNVWHQLREFEKAEGTPGFFEQLLKTVLEHANSQMDNLVTSAAAGDIKKTHYYAHTLKSTTASLGATGLAEYLAEVESDCKSASPTINQRAIEEAQDLFDLFLQEVQAEYDRIARTGA